MRLIFIVEKGTAFGLGAIIVWTMAAYANGRPVLDHGWGGGYG